MKLMSPREIRMILVAAILTSTACGGSNPPPTKPAPPPKQESAAEDDESDHAEPKGPNCSDGSCFRCGKGICLPGFFCDESTANANCQSLYKCVRTASCGCIQEALGAGCACAQRDGGFYVKCKG